MIRQLLPLLAFVACAAAPARDPSAPTANAEPEIARVLDAFHAAAAAADEERYFDQLSEDAVFLGTDASERWTKAEFRAYARPHFARGKAWSFRAIRRAIRVHELGEVAWFDEDLTTPNLGPARGSGVLVRRGQRWKITQYNLALTVPNERFSLVKEAAGGARVRAPIQGDPLRALAWLSGAWLARMPDGALVEEHWTSVDGGSLIGSGRRVEHGKTAFFEHLRIEARGKDVVYVAAPLGETPTEFARTASTASSVVFENSKHDWPQRIEYRKTAEGLSVRVSGAPGARIESWTMLPALVERIKAE